MLPAGLGYLWDANGNLTARLGVGGHQYLTWDAENHLASISGGVSKSYLYDADGVRVKKVAPNGAATYTPFPHYEVSGGVVTKYYFFAGQRIAMKRDGVLTYLHADHLGSIVATTNISGALTSSRGYRAYGNYRRGGDLPTDYRFTGQKQDASGLIYMNARYYDPVLGQFISPDTLVPDPGVLIDYNRYGYARGNPMRFTDPSGHCVWDGCVLEAILIAAIVGSAANATGNVVGQFIEQYDTNEGLLTNIQSTGIDGSEVGIAAGWGAIGGGVAPIVGPVGFIATNALAGVGQKVSTDILIDGKTPTESFLDPNTVLAAGVGAAGAAVGGTMPKVASYVASNGETILIAVGKEAVAYGGANFAQVTEKMLLSEQTASVFSARSIAGAMLTNAPLATSSCTGLGCLWYWILGEQDNSNLTPCTLDPNDGQ
jgi:RHS repeat-associated protein